MNEVCDLGSCAPNMALVVSVLKSICSPLRIFSKIRGVTGGRDGLWIPVVVGDTVKLVPWTVTGGLIMCWELS